jgi:pSer/pThr/pTyr-binding forkhead associated (FHA) protein
MVLLRTISGIQAGAETVARRFPFRVGRAPGSDLRLNSGGVWAEHCTIVRDPVHGLALRASEGALTLLNGAAVREAPLHNGDLLELGEVRLQFWLSPLRQHGLAWRERLTWLGLAGVLGVEFALVYWLTH